MKNINIAYFNAPVLHFHTVYSKANAFFGHFNQSPILIVFNLLINFEPQLKCQKYWIHWSRRYISEGGKKHLVGLIVFWCFYQGFLGFISSLCRKFTNFPLCLNGVLSMPTNFDSAKYGYISNFVKTLWLIQWFSLTFYHKSHMLYVEL